MTLSSESYRKLNMQVGQLPLHTIAVFGKEKEVEELRIKGKAGSDLKEISVTVDTEENAQEIINELQAHLKMPSVWNAVRPRHEKAAWAAGYIQARKYYLNKKEFCTVKAPLTLPIPYSEPPQRLAFQRGVDDYRMGVIAITTLEPYFSEEPL